MTDTASTYAKIAASCGCANLRRASRATTQLYDEILAPAGVRSTQLCVLLACGASADVSITRLSDLLVMDRTTLSRNLRPLERGGLIELTADTSDRRARLVRLTGAGRSRIEAAYPLWQEAQRRLIDALGEERWQRLFGDLDAVVRAARPESTA
jgi:DNA-binding MarR family transcriptional regulator